MDVNTVSTVDRFWEKLTIGLVLATLGVGVVWASYSGKFVWVKDYQSLQVQYNTLQKERDKLFELVLQYRGVANTAVNLVDDRPTPMMMPSGGTPDPVKAGNVSIPHLEEELNTLKERVENLPDEK